MHPVYARLLCAELLRRGFSRETVLGGTGLAWEALHRLGTEHSRVISGDEGLDELSLAGGNEVAVITPEGVPLHLPAAGPIPRALAWATGLPWVTLLLGTSPGGITEMAITAKVLQLGVPVVTAFQVCRLVAVLVLAEPLYRWWTARAPL